MKGDLTKYAAPGVSVASESLAGAAAITWSFDQATPSEVERTIPDRPLSPVNAALDAAAELSKQAAIRVPDEAMGCTVVQCLHDEPPSEASASGAGRSRRASDERRAPGADGVAATNIVGVEPDPADPVERLREEVCADATALTPEHPFYREITGLVTDGLRMAVKAGACVHPRGVLRHRSAGVHAQRARRAHCGRRRRPGARRRRTGAARAPTGDPDEPEPGDTARPAAYPPLRHGHFRSGCEGAS